MTYQPHPLIDKILGCAIRVHRELGPGLLESAYDRCVAYEFTLAGIEFQRQVEIPVSYRGVDIGCGFRADFIVQEEILVELKSVAQLIPVHDAQVLSHLKLTGLTRGLLINFNVEMLRKGVKSYLHTPSARRSPDAEPESAQSR
jgi:GxxExxY protein